MVARGFRGVKTFALVTIMNDINFARDLTPLYKPLRAAAMRLTRDPTAAEDLVQDTMARAWRHRETFIEGSNVKAWASTILRNTFINGYHRQNRAALVLGLPPAITGLCGYTAKSESLADFDPERGLDSTAVLASIIAAIAKLPSEYRTAVTLADLDGLSYQEIADAMECPIGTVMSRIHRGRKALRLALASEAVEFGLRLAA